MMAGMTYYEIATYFVLYSFLGWVLEVAYHAISKGKVINRGFLNGPVCPIYGIGVVAIFMMVDAVSGVGFMQVNAWTIFIGGMVLATLIELIGGWGLDKLFHARWWDYRQEPLNFKGYICLRFSIYWGLAIVFVVRVMHQGLANITVKLIPEKIGWPVLGVLLLIYLVDVVVTVVVVLGWNKQLAEVDELQQSMRKVSDRMTEQIAGGTIEAAQRVGEGRVQVELAKAELRDAALKKREEFLRLTEEQSAEYAEKKKALEDAIRAFSDKLRKHSKMGPQRLLRAFPAMVHREYPELVEEIRRRMDNWKKGD